MNVELIRRKACELKCNVDQFSTLHSEIDNLIGDCWYELQFVKSVCVNVPYAIEDSLECRFWELSGRVFNHVMALRDDASCPF